jgi:hypothetical protein
LSTTTFRLEVSRGEDSFSAEGDAKLVMEAYGQFREDVLVGTTNKTTRSVSNGDSGRKEKKGNTSSKPTTTDNLPLPAFVKAHPPKNLAESVAVLATWANLNDGTTEFTKPTIESLWKRSALRKAGNIHQAMIDAAKEGWLEKSGRGKYEISSYGTAHVLENIVPAEQKD